MVIIEVNGDTYKYNTNNQYVSNKEITLIRQYVVVVKVTKIT